MIFNFIRQQYQIYIGIIYGYIFGKRTPMSEARLELVVANLVIPCGTLGAVPAAAYKGQRNPVTDIPA